MFQTIFKYRRVQIPFESSGSRSCSSRFLGPCQGPDRQVNTRESENQDAGGWPPRTPIQSLERGRRERERRERERLDEGG